MGRGSRKKAKKNKDPTVQTPLERAQGAAEAGSAASRFLSAHSEEVSAATGIAGAILLMLDCKMAESSLPCIANSSLVEFLPITALVAAEATLFKAGKAGYPASCVLLMASDLGAALLTEASKNNPGLKYSLCAMAAASGTGALVYPIKKAAQYISQDSLKEFFNKAADILPAAAGSLNCLLIAPAFASAVMNGQALPAFGLGLWGLSDLLSGRSQEHIPAFVQTLSGRVTQFCTKMLDKISASPLAKKALTAAGAAGLVFSLCDPHPPTKPQGQDQEPQTAKTVVATPSFSPLAVVYFEEGFAEPDPNEIENAMQAIKNRGCREIIVEGSADPEGRPLANKNLERKRAETTANDLKRCLGAGHQFSTATSPDRPPSEDANPAKIRAAFVMCLDETAGPAQPGLH